MRTANLVFISLIVSALALLYLLYVNLIRDSFVFRDWVVVFVDLLVKVIVESVILFKRPNAHGFINK